MQIMSWVLTDLKLWGSYRVAKALGIVEVGKKPDPSGATYKSSGKWGKAGSPKMVPVFQQMPQEADNWESEMQLNRYRVMLEERGITIGRMQVQATVRDGGLAVAFTRGIFRNTCMIPVPRLGDDEVRNYFQIKADNLAIALKDNRWDEPCNDRECWEGVRCKSYCDVARNCPKGILYMQEEK